MNSVQIDGWAQIFPKIFFASFLSTALVQKKITEFRLELSVASVRHHDWTIRNVVGVIWSAKNTYTIDNGRKLNMNSNTIIKHDFASFISLRYVFFLSIADLFPWPAIAFGFCVAISLLQPKKFWHKCM